MMAPELETTVELAWAALTARLMLAPNQDVEAHIRAAFLTGISLGIQLSSDVGKAIQQEQS